MTSISRRHFNTSLAALGLTGQGLAYADAKFPAKPLKIDCPFAPGGGSDFIARVASTVLSERLGQPVYVENRPGAGGTLGTEYALRSAAALKPLAGLRSGQNICQQPYQPPGIIRARLWRQ